VLYEKVSLLEKPPIAIPDHTCPAIKNERRKLCSDDWRGGEGGQHYVPGGYTAVFRAGQQEISLIITQAGSWQSVLPPDRVVSSEAALPDEPPLGRFTYKEEDLDLLYRIYGIP